MYSKNFLVAVPSVLALVFAVAGCGNQPKQDTVSIIDEQHFNELASVPVDGQGNAAIGVEIMNPVPSLAQAPAPAISEPVINAASAVIAAPKGATFEQKVQTALQNSGFYSGTLDGKIGQKTREAIKSFQTANGLKSDGVVGPSTWEKLKQHLSGPTGSTGS